MTMIISLYLKKIKFKREDLFSHTYSKNMPNTENLFSVNFKVFGFNRKIDEIMQQVIK